MEKNAKQQAADEVYRTFAAYSEATKIAQSLGIKVESNMWNGFISVTEVVPYIPTKEGKEYCISCEEYMAKRDGQTGLIGVV